MINPLFDEAADVVTLPSGLNGTSSKAGPLQRNPRFDAQSETVVLPPEIDTILGPSPSAGSQQKPVEVIFSNKGQEALGDSQRAKHAPDTQQGAAHYPEDPAGHGAPTPQPAAPNQSEWYAPPPHPTGYYGKPSKHKAVPCRYHSQGNCTKGDSCQFGHFHVEPAYPTDPMYMGEWGYAPPPPPPQPVPYYGPSYASSEIPPHPDWQPSAPPGGSWGGGKQFPRQMAPPKKWAAGGGFSNGDMYCGYPPARGGPGGAPMPEDPEDSGAGRVGKLRAQLESLRNAGGRWSGLFPALKVVIEKWDEEDRKVLVGLRKNDIGLTRFQSMLIKRTLCHCVEAGHVGSLDSLVDWEKSVMQWLPPIGKPFSRFFEDELCLRMVEVVRCMAASPCARFRLPEGALDSAKTDPMAAMFRFWEPHSSRLVQHDLFNEFPNTQIPKFTPPEPSYSAYFTHESGVPWTPATHRAWPAPFRGRMRAFFMSLTRTPQYDLSLSMIARVFSFLPPVCNEDIPESDFAEGKHEFLDITCEVLANYSLNVLGAEDEEELSAAKERLGRAAWPLILSVFGDNCAPKITGMFLQMDVEDMLLDIVNGRRIIESLQEAWRVWENSFQGG